MKFKKQSFLGAFLFNISTRIQFGKFLKHLIAQQIMLIFEEVKPLE